MYNGFCSFGRLIVITVLFAIVLWISGCGDSKAPDGASQQINVVVSILPQAYMVEQIGKDRVHVTVMVLPGSNPATYEPSSEQMKSLSDADIYVRIRVPFEDSWMEKFESLNPKMKTIDQSMGIERITGSEYNVTHDHSGGEDPHIWLSPTLVMTQVENIRQGLSDYDPASAKFYEENAAAFNEDIDFLHRYIKASFDGVPRSSFITFHPSWTYFARDYGLKQVVIEVEGKEPSASELMDIIEIAKRERLHVVFASPQFSRRSAEVLAKEIDGNVVMIDPLARDWAANLRHVAETIAGELVKP